MSDDRRQSRGSKYTREQRGPRRSQRDAKDAASYKADLEKFFTAGGKTPERFEKLAKGLAPREGSAEAEYLEAVDTLRKAGGLPDLVKAINDFVAAGHPWPDDEEVLIKALDHPRERTLHGVLDHLIDLQARKGIKRGVAIKARLGTLKVVSDDPGLLKKVDALEALL
ncbi:hypothetical protein FRC91_10095 [Bradymonadales bacterium TMQ1]|uniref:Uncharacterized protein n=1 Tax=Lujinxingia sediminis TaxID=2480984 RepID=A0ABY0CS27_9DELT|nr:hypothetical protein [Lujinxingia sediminis]RVU43628.1 hypothetical protein EA187_12435 [Lujinxingia sediminis]TXC75843.1 hypothetical protein FRC91_10095 [Bradymonadales bacterium TMQ1]